MKVQKKVNIQIQTEWIKIKEDVFDGNIIGILDSGIKIEGRFGLQSIFKVSTKNGDRSLSFNQTSINHLIDAYGDDTEEWVGKSIKIWIVKSNVSGKMKDVVYLTAPDWIEGKDGFVPPEDKIPLVEDDESQ